jgi:hypothetical protein
MAHAPVIEFLDVINSPGRLTACGRVGFVEIVGGGEQRPDASENSQISCSTIVRAA